MISSRTVLRIKQCHKVALRWRAGKVSRRREGKGMQVTKESSLPTMMISREFERPRFILWNRCNHQTKTYDTSKWQAWSPAQVANKHNPPSPTSTIMESQTPAHRFCKLPAECRQKEWEIEQNETLYPFRDHEGNGTMIHDYIIHLVRNESIVDVHSEPGHHDRTTIIAPSFTLLASGSDTRGDV